MVWFFEKFAQAALIRLPENVVKRSFYEVKLDNMPKKHYILPFLEPILKTCLKTLSTCQNSGSMHHLNTCDGAFTCHRYVHLPARRTA